MNSPLMDSIAKAIGSAAMRVNQRLKERTAKGHAPDPHHAQTEVPSIENLKDISGEIARITAQSVTCANKSLDLDR